MGDVMQNQMQIWLDSKSNEKEEKKTPRENSKRPIAKSFPHMLLVTTSLISK